jgi:hypothetical protein
MKIWLSITLLFLGFCSFSQNDNPLLGGIWEIQTRYYAYYKASNMFEYSKDESSFYNHNEITFLKDSILSFTVELITINLVKDYTFGTYLPKETDPINLNKIVNSYGKDVKRITYIDKYNGTNDLYLIENEFLLLIQDFNIFVLKRKSINGRANWQKDKNGDFVIRSMGYKSFDFLLPTQFKAVEINGKSYINCKNHIMISTLNDTNKEIAITKNLLMNDLKLNFGKVDLRKKINISVESDDGCNKRNWTIVIKVI